MRLAVFIGLQYVAWCINPTVYDSISGKWQDLILIGIVTFLCSYADFKELKKLKDETNRTI